MARVRSKDSRPELLVRRLVFAMGYRYRLHAKDLPGCPDLVFRPRQKAIFVHGCFWHRHENCALARMPKSRREFWGPKLEGNKQRDDKRMEHRPDRGGVQPGQLGLLTVGSTTYQPSLRSFHVGLALSIKAIFFARIQPLSCFSLAIALSGPVNRSNHTSRLQLYFDENPS